MIDWIRLESSKTEMRRNISLKQISHKLEQQQITTTLIEDLLDQSKAIFTLSGGARSAVTTVHRPRHHVPPALIRTAPWFSSPLRHFSATNLKYLPNNFILWYCYKCSALRLMQIVGRETSRWQFRQTLKTPANDNNNYHVPWNRHVTKTVRNSNLIFFFFFLCTERFRLVTFFSEMLSWMCVVRSLVHEQNFIKKISDL